MSGRERIRRSQLIRQAEGYLELEMPDHALASLERIEEPATFKGHIYYLRGEALRALSRYADALVELAKAVEANPSNIHIRLAQGWCFKRNGQLPLAIRALEEGLEFAGTEAILHYNLACYRSLSGDKPLALTHLARAMDLDSTFRDLVDRESDFDPIRSDPDFIELMALGV